MKISRPLLFALFFMGFLFLVKIVLLPLWGWRGEQVARLQQARKKKVRIERLLARAPVYDARLKAAQDLNLKLQEYCFPAADGGDKMQLKMQRSLEGLMAAGKIEVLSTKWYKSLQDHGIWQASVEIRGQGKVAGLCRLVAVIENHRPCFQVVSLVMAAPKRARQVKLQMTLKGFGVAADD